MKKLKIAVYFVCVEMRLMFVRTELQLTVTSTESFLTILKNSIRIYIIMIDNSYHCDHLILFRN